MEITDSNFQSLVLSKPILLVDCWAPWCGPCRMLSPIMDELEKEYEGKISIGKLNVDENPLVCQNYEIMSIPTVLCFQNGELIHREVGAAPKAKWKILIESLLK